jgi:hypothetical protein
MWVELALLGFAQYLGKVSRLPPSVASKAFSISSGTILPTAEEVAN